MKGIVVCKEEEEKKGDLYYERGDDCSAGALAARGDEEGERGCDCCGEEDEDCSGQELGGGESAASADHGQHGQGEDHAGERPAHDGEEPSEDDAAVAQSGDAHQWERAGALFVSQACCADGGEEDDSDVKHERPDGEELCAKPGDCRRGDGSAKTGVECIGPDEYA